MSRRLQVLFEADELREIGRAARKQGLTVAEWVRRALRESRRSAPSGDPRKKLEAIRAAAAYSFPSGDVATMLAEIEQGYSGSRRT